MSGTDFVDLEGLCTDGSRAVSYADALNLTGHRLTKEARTLVLARLQRGYGARVCTGPTGAAFWSLVSPEVEVRVVPDDYTYKYRASSVEEWSYLAAGCTPAETKLLLSRTTPPTRKSKVYPKYTLSLELKQALVSCMQEGVEPIIRGTVPYTIITDINRQLELLANLPDGVALDLEWVKNESTLIGVNVSTSDNNWYLPTLAAGFDQTALQVEVLRGVLGAVRSKETVWHQFKADAKLLADDPATLFGVNAHDTILMAYVAGHHDLGLKELTRKLLGRQVVELPDALETLPMETAARYGAAGDSRNTYDLFVKLKKELEDTDQWYVYSEIERPLVPLVSSMEKLGFPLDLERVEELRNEYQYMEQALRSLIWAKHRLDVDRTDDQHTYIERNYGYRLGTLHKRILARISGDWMDTLLGYRQVVTLRRNFLDKHLGDGICSPISGYRAYPTFNQAGRDTESGGWVNAPATGRFSSASPNLQNQPRAIRECFVAPDGYDLVALDYSGLELTVAASLSQDPVMLSVIGSGASLHDYMRERIIMDTGVDPTRTVAKNANFNLRYGGHADRLIEIAAQSRATLDYQLAKSIVDVDRSTYVGYWNWYDQLVDTARRNGYAETLWGRRRYDSNINSPDPTRRGHAERALANMVVQGTAADIIKIAMSRLPPIMKHYGAHMALQVHDELVFWVPSANAVPFKIAAAAVMESVQIPHLRLRVEGGIGKRWSDAKG